MLKICKGLADTLVMSNISLSTQQLLAQALAQLNSTKGDLAVSAVTPAKAVQALAASQSAQQNPITSQIQNQIRQLMANADSPVEAIRSIENALADNSVVKSPVTKSLLEQTLKQVQQRLINGQEFDAQKIKQLLTSSPMNTAQLTSAISASGLLGGLARLMQITLISRLANNQPAMSESMSNLFGSFLETASKTSKAQIAQSAKDINSLDQKHQILQQLQRIFSQHHANKLLSAEQNIQGQDSLYYILPSAVGQLQKDIEVLIKREDADNAENKANASQNKTWQLTMKLPVGEQGELLTKVKLNDNELEINFYASNNQLKNRVSEYVPMLVKRLEILGVCISSTQCQIGKIPDSLMTRPYQLFQTRA